MSHSLETAKTHCPNCGEVIELVIDCSVQSQEYIEDCQVCCQAITVSVTLDQDGLPTVSVAGQDE